MGGRGDNTLRWSQLPASLDLTEAIAQSVSKIGRLDLTGAETSNIALEALPFARRAANPNGLILLVDPSDQVQITDIGWSRRESQDGFERLRRGTLDLSITAGANITTATPELSTSETVAAFVADSNQLPNVTMYENQIADFDFDGDPDIAFESGQILRNDGAGAFTLIENVGRWLSVVADFDSDGDIDLLSGQYDEAVWLNDGIGSFTSVDSGLSGRMVQKFAADLNQDGFVDLVTTKSHTTFDQNDRADRSGRIHVRLGDGTGNFETVHQVLSVEESPRLVSLADVDGDGDVDIIHTYGSSATKIFLNSGDGTFTESPNKLPIGYGVQHIAWEDIDGDGDFDAFVANYYGRQTAVLLNAGDGSFTRSPQDLFDIGLAGSDKVTLADVDGDGDWDAIVRPVDRQTWESLPQRILINDGRGQFEDSGIRFHKIDVIGAADFDLDGAVDLLSVDYGTTPSAVRILWNRGRAEALALPDTGGTYTLGRDGNQYVVTNSDGQELIRGSLTTDVLVVQGSAADDHLVIDWTNGNPIPEFGLRFLAQQDTTGDSLEFLAAPISADGFATDVLNDNPIVVDGRPIQTLSVESVQDRLVA